MSSTRSDRGFRFPLQKYSDEKALYTNFRYLQEYLNYIRKKDRYATQVIIATATSAQDAQLRAHYITDGTNDQAQITSAAGDIPSEGGEIVFLDGTYTISDDVTFSTPVRLTSKGAKLSFGANAHFQFNSGTNIVDGFDITRTANSEDYILGAFDNVRVIIANNYAHDIQCRTFFTWAGSSGTPCHVLAFGNFFEDIELRHDGSSRKIGVFGWNDSDKPVSGVIASNHFETITGTGGTNTSFYIAVADDPGANLLLMGNAVDDSTLSGLGTEKAVASHNLEDGVMQSGSHGDVDHGGLSGLTDDDHTQYLLADGTRNLTAKLEFDEASEPAAPGTDDVVVWAEDEQGFGTLHWKASEDIAFELSRDRHLIARNQTGAQINAGEAVYISGSTGTVPNIAKAKADASATMPAVGIAISNIADTSFGRVKLAGDIDDLDLLSFNDGDVLYVSDATAGALTATKPAAGSLKQPVGSVTTAGTGANGVFLVDVGNALVEADIDHGSLGGLSDDDHPQYFSESNSAEISALTLKSPLAAGDHVLIEDSAASNAKKRTTVADVRSAETDHGLLTGLTDDDHTQYLLADGTREITFLDVGGLTGATAASRYVGATASGAPASGTFAVGDYVITQDGNVYICTTAGSPGTWTLVGGAAGTDADAIHDNVAGEIAAITDKATPAAGDHFVIEDSAASDAKKSLEFSSLEGAIDHGSIAGLTDDDHSFYPKGVLGYAEVTASQTGISAETDLTGLSVTVSVAAGRRIKITGHGIIIKRTASATPNGGIKESTTALGDWVNDSLEVDDVTLGDASVIVSPSSGSHTYKLTLTTGLGTVDLFAASDNAAFILVEDIGPA